MPFEEPEPRAWPRLKKARNFFSIPFSRSSFPAFFLGLMISRSLLILGLSLPGKAASPHLLAFARPSPGRGVFDLGLFGELAHPRKNNLCRGDLKLPVVAFSLLGYIEHLSPLTWFPIYLTHSKLSGP